MRGADLRDEGEVADYGPDYRTYSRDAAKEDKQAEEEAAEEGWEGSVAVDEGAWSSLIWRHDENSDNLEHTSYISAKLGQPASRRGMRGAEMAGDRLGVEMKMPVSK